MGATRTILAPLMVSCLLMPACSLGNGSSSQIEQTEQAIEGRVDETLVWNEVLLDAIISSTLGNPPSIRVGAIVHTAMFDAHNGVERRYTSIHEEERAPRGASRRAAVVGAAYRTLVTLYPAQKDKFDAQRAQSIAQLSDDDEDCSHGNSLDLGLAWGDKVAQDILAWRSTDGFDVPVSSFTGGTAVGQWRSTADPPASMAGQSVAFTHDLRDLRPTPVPARQAPRPGQRRLGIRLQRSQADGRQDRVRSHPGPDRPRLLLQRVRHHRLVRGAAAGRSRPTHHAVPERSPLRSPEHRAVGQRRHHLQRQAGTTAPTRRQSPGGPSLPSASATPTATRTPSLIRPGRRSSPRQTTPSTPPRTRARTAPAPGS